MLSGKCSRFEIVDEVLMYITNVILYVTNVFSHVIKIDLLFSTSVEQVTFETDLHDLIISQTCDRRTCKF
jgi:hypothetical protein